MFVLLSYAAFGTASLPAQTKAAPLTRVIEVRHLSAAAAAAKVPVRLTGVVTDVSGYKTAFFLDDGSAGISVEDSAIRVHAGDRVEVVGVTGPGSFAPLILATQVRVTGAAPPPRAKLAVAADLIGGAQDSQWIEVRGIVHSTLVTSIFGHDTLSLSLDIGGAVMRVLVQEFSASDPERLVDATISVRGVCITNFNEQREYIGAGMIVPFRRDVVVLEPAPADPFALAATPIGDAMRFGSGRHRIKVTGTVTYQIPGRAVYLQDGHQAIRVQTTSTQAVAPGDRVEAVGFPYLGEYSPILADALIRPAGKSVPIQPAPLTAETVITVRGEFRHAEYDHRLVQISAPLLGSHRLGAERVLILQQRDGSTFEAFLRVVAGSPATGDAGAALESGSLLRLTGICSIHTDADRNPNSFTILLRSPADIAVERKAPWWNAAHLFMLLAALSLAVLAATLWVMLLRRQVHRQTSLLRASEEKYRYLATHDSLTGLLNRPAILEALEAGVEEARQRRAEIGVAVIDLDHFKSVNDTLGHHAGDEVLRQAARRLSSAVRQTDVVGRYGGEEFLVVFRNMNQQLSVERGETIRMTLSRDPVVFEGKPLKVTGSIGIACSQAGYPSPGELIAQADTAMYQAKTGGRNRVVYFSAPDAGSMAFAGNGSAEAAVLDKTDPDMAGSGTSTGLEKKTGRPRVFVHR